MTLTNQCSRDYFYGKDQVLEKAIQSVEGAYAQTLSNILQAGFHVTDETREVLRVFWLMQHMRTEAAAKRAAAWSVAMANRAGVDESSFRLEIKEAVRLGMLVFASEMHAIDDVKICLLRNCTGIPFVTSDDPAVLTNRWNLIDPKRAAQTFGIGSAGNLFLLPLSPEVLCLGYDGTCIALPTRMAGSEYGGSQTSILLSAHRRGDFRVISPRVGGGYSGALSAMSRCV